MEQFTAQAAQKTETMMVASEKTFIFHENSPSPVIILFFTRGYKIFITKLTEQLSYLLHNYGYKLHNSHIIDRMYTTFPLWSKCSTST